MPLGGLKTYLESLIPRMGWLYADPAVVRQMVVAKQASDLCSNFLTQHILYEYLRKADEKAHLAALRQCYRQRRDTMLALLKAHVPAGVSWTRPAGGMFLWMTLPPDVSAGDLLVRSAERGVVFAPGESFYPERPQTNTMRLNFTHAEPAEMAQGIGILAEELRGMM